MTKYEICISEDAANDITNLSDVIMFEYKAPATAFKYIQGMITEIKKLTYSAESYAIQTTKALQAYGPLPRRLNYKQMAIIYNVVGNVVYIRRVIPAKNISSL